MVEDQPPRTQDRTFFVCIIMDNNHNADNADDDLAAGLQRLNIGTPLSPEEERDPAQLQNLVDGRSRKYYTLFGTLKRVENSLVSRT